MITKHSTMKHVIFAMSLLALASCKDSKKQETHLNTDDVEVTNGHDNDEATNLYENDWTGVIETDNGAKWEANSETNEGVKKMLNSIKTQTTSTLDDYHKLAELLNTDKNYVIKNCTMKGGSHDNLHVWLLPLMEKIEALSETKTVDDASKLKQSINENINEYNTYFQ